MIELSRIDFATGASHLGFAGDTANTAVYLARAGLDVSYITNLGRDAFSDRMVAEFAAEGISTALIGRHPDRLPGVYAIEIDAAGERSFRYWRENAAARTLFSGVGPGLDDLASFDVIYLSGITLAILPYGVRAALLVRLGELRATGATVVFDSNYRPRLWSSPAAAAASFDDAWAASSIALPSRDDEALLHPHADAKAVMTRIAALGAGEVVLKNGAAGPMILSAGKVIATDLPRAARVVDTSGAGDSFNAGYLAARLRGAAPAEAAAAGHALAIAVISHHGAIIPRA